MAEIVEYRKERLVPEYEQMKRINLVDDEEIRQIKIQREAFEYKVGKPSKTLKDFVRYIKYERSLLLLLHERRKTRRIHDKKNSIEFKIGNRILHLYQQAIDRFPQDLKIWDDYIKFCSLSRKISKVPIVLDKMTRLHGDKPEVWLRAALWSYNEGRSMERTRHFLTRGLQRHPKCEELYQSFISIELTEGAKLCSDLVLMDSTESEQSLALRRAMVVYELSKTELPSNIDYLESIRTMTIPFEYAYELCTIVNKDIRQIEKS